MPEKSKNYDRVIFSPEVMQEASDMITTNLPEKQREFDDKSLDIELPSGETWDHDNEEEFFADYRKGFVRASFEKSLYKAGARIEITAYQNPQLNSVHTEVSVRMPTRTEVERIFEVIESNVVKCRLPVPPRKRRPKHSKPNVRVFVGHGQSQLWRDLKDHLHEKHSISVEAYEIGAKAGLTIKEILSDMLTSSSFALLVMTGEDRDKSGKLHARENVIHELGLFQGHLGWRKAIVLLEESVEEFSNIQGLQQIRFSAGNIKETFGEVLATIQREFPKDE